MADNKMLAKHKAEAKVAGLSLIGPEKDVHYRTYRFNTCGHEQETQVSSVRRDSFICSMFEESARDLRSNAFL